MKVGIIVEGESDKRVLKEILSKYGIKHEIRMVSGFSPRKFNALSARLYESGCEKVVILRDTQCKRKEEMYEELKKKKRIEELKEGINVCFAQCELEAWLLADERAFRSAIGIDAKDIPHPESLEKPKEEIGSIFREFKGFKSAYIPTEHAPKIAHNIDINRIENKCNSFKEFISTIRNSS